MYRVVDAQAPEVGSPGQHDDKATFAVPLDPRAARQARRIVCDLLRAWRADEDLVYDAQLVAIELVTNAVSHGGAQVVLEVEHRPDGRIRLAVRDGSPRMPCQREVGMHDETGRGLAIVEGLALDWGVQTLDGGGKQVWALLRSAWPQDHHDMAGSSSN